MERLANYQQMVDPTMVWGAIKSNDAVRMDVSFTWKKEEWLIPAVFPIPGGLVVDVARKLPYYHLKNRLTIYEKHRNAGFHSPRTADDGSIRSLSFSSYGTSFDRKRLY